MEKPIPAEEVRKKLEAQEAYFREKILPRQVEERVKDFNIAISLAADYVALKPEINKEVEKEFHKQLREAGYFIYWVKKIDSSIMKNFADGWEHRAYIRELSSKELAELNKDIDLRFNH